MAKKQSKVVGENALVIGEEALKDKIYFVRGQKVMLDYDLAEIYGYTTSAFNRQVKNNVEKFEGEDFMFQLNDDESRMVLRCKNCILEKTREEHFRYSPYAFTEQGIYMLMTVLRGELAVKQSRALIRMFKVMKDYVAESRGVFEYRTNLSLIEKMIDDSRSIKEIKGEIKRIDSSIDDINKRLDETVKNSEISPLLLDFKRMTELTEFVFTGDQLIMASEIYMGLYSRARKSIYIIDDYVGIKTLRHLQNVGPGVEIVVISDNKGGYLHREDYEDFQKDCHKNIRFVRTEGKVHDRFVVLDYGTVEEQIYYFGASEKDAGGKISTMARFGGGIMKDNLHNEIGKLMRNKELEL